MSYIVILMSFQTIPSIDYGWNQIFIYIHYQEGVFDD